MSKKLDFTSHYDKNFRLFFELMGKKIQEILMVSSPYDAFKIEEDGSLASRIINEYSGLNLSKPPRITRLSSATDALSLLEQKDFDLIIVTPNLEDMDVFSLALEIKELKPFVPIYLLSQSSRGIFPAPEGINIKGIDKIFIWSGNSDLLLAIIKNTEDHLNVDFDTKRAHVPVLLYVEDSPLYYSTLLPYIYKEVVKQTQSVLEAGLNEEHRLLKMRARPKILLARNYEEALQLYDRYTPFLLGVIADTRFPRKGEARDDAGIAVLSTVRKDFPFVPLLLMSSESQNRKRADTIPAKFIDKNSPHLLSELHDFFLTDLGFGDFVFKMPDGKEIDRASNLQEIELKISQIPDESFIYHAQHNHFSTWMMARSETGFAFALREVSLSEFSNLDEARNFVTSHIHALRKWHQKGVITKFKAGDFDADIMDLVTIGEGSIGGKARALAFLTELIHKNSKLLLKYPRFTITIPQMLVLCTDIFDSFFSDNKLDRFNSESMSREDINNVFLAAAVPKELEEKLQAFLTKVTYPLSIRSSNLLQDTQFDPSLECYETYMIPNNHKDLSTRLTQLVTAIKLVYASAFYGKPERIYPTTPNQPYEERMAVIVQQLVGNHYGNYFYPCISGTARSYNYYPVSHMKPREGVVEISLGFSKGNEQETGNLRFSPLHPSILPQFSTVDDILRNSQNSFLALTMKGHGSEKIRNVHTLEERYLSDAQDEYPVKMLSGTYIPQEHTITDTGFIQGPKVVTFSRILKNRNMPLPELISDLLEMGRKGMGCPVEINFALNLTPENGGQCDFFLLKIRPMVAYEDSFEVQISSDDTNKAFCFSTQALGHGKKGNIADIVYIKPGDFKRECTVEMAREIGKINGVLAKEKRPYLLVGPGRWGSADRWLGIPVRWNDISGVGAFIELEGGLIQADASRGCHFFRNITSQEIPYLTIVEGSNDYFDWEWIYSLTTAGETQFVRHVSLAQPMTLIIDGRKSHCVIRKP